ncbi:MAG: hypothetical protein KIT66_02660 [Chitinophagaceae bacterium]|nr:hypothetical protein [Chitinophagaceae bacterium]
MKALQTAIERPLQYYRQWDFLIFTVLTLLSVVNGQSTVFYLLYFFWWNELIRLLVDRLCYKRNKNVVYEGGKTGSFFQSLFLMAIYWVFLVVIFGFIAASDSTEIMIANMQVLFFHNWFFNANLVFVLLQRWYLHKTRQPLRIYFEAFNPNTIVLHISIIVGAVLMFFVVRKYPEIFTPENRWGSALIILPFLLLKMLMQRLVASDIVIQKQNNK